MHMMSGMGHEVWSASIPVVAPRHEAVAPCERQVCVEPTALKVGEGPTADHLNLLQRAFVFTLVAWPVAERLPSWLSDPPPPRRNSLVSLHTVLRV